MRIHGWRLLATLGVLGAAIVATAWSIAPANAAIETYDITMKMTATTTNGIRWRDRRTREMTFDPVTGDMTFDVSRVGGAPEFRIRGTGNLYDGQRAVGTWTYDAFSDPDPTPRFTGSALFFGKVKRGRAKLFGRFTALDDSNGTAPAGYMYIVGKVRAVRR